MGKKLEYPGHLVARRGGVWYWRMMAAGQFHYRTFHVAGDKALAAQLARSEAAKLVALDTRRAAGLPVGTRIGDVFDAFAAAELTPQGGRISDGSRRTYGHVLQFLRRYFVNEHGNALVEQIRATDVSAYLAWRRAHRGGAAGGGTCSPRTLQKDAVVLQTICNWAIDHDLMVVSPVKRRHRELASPGRAAIVLTDGDVAKLLTACADRPMLRLFVLAMWETGLRPNSELLWLRWEDIRFDAGFVDVVSGRDGHDTKTQRSRAVPMSVTLRAALREHFARYRLNQSPWLFHHLSTRRNHKRGARIQTLLNSFHRAVERAALAPTIRPYDLRHSRITAWIAEGHSPALVQKAAGHAAIATTMGYTHLVEGHLLSLVGRSEGQAAG